MNWVNSIGSLLESVDQHAALTLAPGAESDDEQAQQTQTDDGLLGALKTRLAQASPPSVDSTTSSTNALPPDASLVVAGTSPPGSASSARRSATPTPSPPRSASGLSAEDESARLRKDVARAKAELRAKENALATAQKRVRVYEEEIEALESECKEKIAEVQLQLTRLRQEKDADERNFVQALELKESQAQTAVLELEALQEAKRLQAGEIAALRAELAKAVESKESLWTSAASASNDSEQLVLSLRAELDDTLAAMTNLKKEHDAAKLSMFARQTQLEKTNTELGAHVAGLERDLARAREMAAAATVSGSAYAGSSGPGSSSSYGNGTSGSSNGSLAALSDDYRRVQQSLVLAKKALHDETRKNEIQTQETLALRDELQRVRHATEAAQQSASQQLYIANRENERLKEQLSQSAVNNQSSSAGAAGAETRIQALTNRLVEKQETVDALRSKVATLEIRVADAQNRSQRAEERLAQIERNGGILDMEMATPVGKRGGGSVNARSRPNRMANMISRVAPVVERSSRVVTALDVLDRWLLFLGRVFLSYPFARLGLLCYIALIHFWVFVVLSFHTSHLSEEVQQQQQQLGADAAVSDVQSPEHDRLERDPDPSPRWSPRPPAAARIAPPLSTATADADADAADFAYREMSESPGMTTTYGSSAADAEVAWLRRCLPVFVQPEVDIANENELVKVFFQFERQADSGRLDCRLCIVFASEASYNRVKEESQNTCATILYRTFNRRTYKRTADINYMEFRNVDLDPKSPTPWTSVFSQDHGGEQQWSQGAKRNVGDWFSLMHHYRVEVAYEAWTKRADSHRPLVYLNTCNHMIGERDNNARMRKYEWVEYPFQEGDAEDAFHYVVEHIPTKFNLYSYVCCWSARNGGGWCDRHHAGTKTRSGGSICVQHALTNWDDKAIIQNAKMVSGGAVL